MPDDSPPLVAYANDHEHICPFCRNAILVCGPIAETHVPGWQPGMQETMTDYMRPSSQAHDERVRSAMLEHRCYLESDRVRFHALLVDRGFVSE
jgi:hypothetical protein